MMFAPLEGWRHVKVTDRHTAVDYAQVLKELSDTHYPNASQIVLVQDNLNTHKYTKLFQPKRHVGWLSASSGITRPNTEAGSTWQNPNSAC